jgi:hypothetical protein
MTPVMRSCIGLFACLALTLTVADAVRAADSSAGAPPPVTASQSADAQGQPATEHPSHEQLVKEMEEQPAPPCMAGSKMGMQGMGPKPGMPGMMGMQEMRMPGMQTQGMGMPGMGMPGMEMMGMPMMQDHMMRMMARNPKLAGKMMQMRADMMRAIADVLTKYGTQMESGDWPAAPAKGGGDN